ncbi:uncharacterized protein LOC121672487 [Corvus kubaryi]|uniref:uncharacterized protein LOC121672477 n=1 Tax=Corvus kubaryi TaxID=68294 RepID=UPI001C05250A|nr:uncharacterized protein LOC121672477 [Corvus kubaryi]XP_041901079.1 uncharacterized protein LOC121672487 [Corvus kubaryi]
MGECCTPVRASCGPSPGPGWGWDALCSQWNLVHPVSQHCHLGWGWDALHSRREWGNTVPQRGATCAPVCAGMGPGCSMFPTGTGARSTVPPVLCHLRPGSAPCSQRELGDAAPQGRAACTPSPRRAGVLRIPAGPLCPGWCPRSVCNQPRSRVRPGPVPAPAWKRGSGSRGSQSRGAQPGERPRERERGGGSVLGDATAPGTRGHGPAMARLLPLLLLAALGCAAKPCRRPAAGGDGADAQRASARGCANLTLVLDNWKFAITSQLRNLLLSDHQTVLPDYGRIPALSGALDELYRDFRALKEQLGRLSDRFAHLEASVEQLSRARSAAAPPRRGGVLQSPRRVPGTPQ